MKAGCTQMLEPLSGPGTNVRVWRTGEGGARGMRGAARAGPSHQAVLTPGMGSDLTSKQIGGVPDAQSQMRKQSVQEVRASRTRRSRASVFLCQRWPG